MTGCMRPWAVILLHLVIISMLCGVTCLYGLQRTAARTAPRAATPAVFNGDYGDGDYCACGGSQ